VSDGIYSIIYDHTDCLNLTVVAVCNGVFNSVSCRRLFHISDMIQVPHNIGYDIERACDVSYSNARNSGLLRA
jgi:hypothetical protein